MKELWVDKYKPNTLNDYLGTDSFKQKLAKFIDDQSIPNLLFSGTAGKGKTSAAMLLVKLLQCDHMIINASIDNGIDVIRNRVQEFAAFGGMTGFKIIILDEADYLSPASQKSLRRLIEEYSNTTRFILTCNYKNMIIDPLQSRLKVIDMQNIPKKQVVLKCVDVLKNEGVSYTKESLSFYIRNYYPDFRSILIEMENNVIDGNLVIDEASSNVKYLDDIITELSSKNTKSDIVRNIRQILTDNSIRSYDSVFKHLFDNVSKFSNGNDIDCIIAINEAQIADSNAINGEINIAAMFSKLVKINNG